MSVQITDALLVVLIASDERIGKVFGRQTAREYLEVRVTPSGLIRVYPACPGTAPWATTTNTTPQPETTPCDP